MTTFNDQVNQFVQEMSKLPQATGAATTFRIDAPQIYRNLDRDAVKAHNVQLGTLFTTLQTMLSTLYINDFNLYGRAPTGCRSRRCRNIGSRRRISAACLCEARMVR